MEFRELSNLIFNELIPKLENHNGISIFIRERSKFEGWLKVELCEILSKYSEDLVPEKGRIDIVFNDWALELKTINTSYRDENTVTKNRPISKNIKRVIKDIEKMKKQSEYINKAILFIVYPVRLGNEYWETHFRKIKTAGIKECEIREFVSKNGVRGAIYFCLI